MQSSLNSIRKDDEVSVSHSQGVFMSLVGSSAPRHNLQYIPGTAKPFSTETVALAASPNASNFALSGYFEVGGMGKFVDIFSIYKHVLGFGQDGPMHQAGHMISPITANGPGMRLLRANLHEMRDLSSAILCDPKNPNTLNGHEIDIDPLTQASRLLTRSFFTTPNEDTYFALKRLLQTCPDKDAARKILGLPSDEEMKSMKGLSDDEFNEWLATQNAFSPLKAYMNGCLAVYGNTIELRTLTQESALALLTTQDKGPHIF